MTISAQMVKELRVRTGAGMMDCKKALLETGGDLDQAIDLMRKSGAAKAAKKAGRIAAEGLVHLLSRENEVAMVEVNSETDFVAKSDDFIAFVQAISQCVISQKPQDLTALSACAVDGVIVEEMRKNLIAKIGENISLRRFSLMQATSDQVLGYYQHGERIAVSTILKGGDAALAKDIAMHIAASKPECIDASQIDQALLDRERAIFVDQAAQSGKPAEIVEKMVDGKMRKFTQEITLLGQAFIKNPDVTVGQLLKENQAEVMAFTRFEVGEGIEKKQDDFVAEVMAQAKG